MAKDPPVIYVLHGDDEFAIAQFVADLKAKLGDSSMAEMNFTKLDGRSLALDDLISATNAMPFLAKRRLAVLYHPLAYFKHTSTRQKLLDYLGKIPGTAALVLVEYQILTDERERKKGKIHWLEDWAIKAGDRVYIRAFSQPKGAAMARWIQERARAHGGQFDNQAAGTLGSLVGDDTRLADHEIQKMLLYVNFQRAVEVDDVQHLTAQALEGDIFGLVDALGNRNSRVASTMLHRLLEEDDPLRIFGMIIRQFRLILLAREILDHGGHEDEVARRLKIHPYVAKKVTAQARGFSRIALEEVYHHLLEVDEAIKTGRVDADLGLDVFIAQHA
jgi:DNA polymerase-3 subunit delta